MIFPVLPTAISLLYEILFSFNFSQSNPRIVFLWRIDLILFNFKQNSIYRIGKFRINNFLLTGLLFLFSIIFLYNLR